MPRLTVESDLAFDLPMAANRVCAVRIAMPPGRMPAAGWPLAYVLDMHQFDVMCADPGGLPGLLVGLGPGVPQHRVWDYTPRHAGRPAMPPGIDSHAAHWLRVLDRVRARIATAYRLDARRQVLCGHSLGALFALYVMTHRPGAFDGYVLSSPSVWWGNGYAGRLLRRRRAWLCAQGLPALGINLTVGEHEQGLGPEDIDAPPEERARRLALRHSRRMVDDLRALATEFSLCADLRLRHAVLPGHSHQSASRDALMSGWRWLLQASRARLGGE